jgi:hypothetical protein
MTWLWPSLLGLSRVVQPDTILRWHRAGFRSYWRWKSRGRPGRPRVGRELRELIQRMSTENPLWGASRIHGELLKLGFEIAESTVSRYVIRRRDPPSQTWRTFLRNHADAIAAIDLCLVPTLTFERLFLFLVVGHGRISLKNSLSHGGSCLATGIASSSSWANDKSIQQFKTVAQSLPDYHVSLLSKRRETSPEGPEGDVRAHRQDG